MAFESIACPDCNATADFKQVDADTYYCPYHKGLFKWVDPSRVKVTQVASDCSCGNSVVFQCQLCKQGLCAKCDAIESQKRILEKEGHRSSGWRKKGDALSRVITPVRGFGYLEYVHPSTVWSITGNRVKKTDVAGRVLGPFLTLGDILPQLSADPAGLRHVCCTCVVAGVPLAVAAITSGQECEQPGCGTAPAGTCRCCGNHFCAQHFMRNVSEFIGRSELVYAESKRFRLPSRAGLCLICGDECMLAALEAIERLLGANPWARVFGLERKVSDMLDEFDRTSRACRRNQFFDQRITSFRVPPVFGPVHGPTYDAPASYDFKFSTYTVLDERDQVSPAPA